MRWRLQIVVLAVLAAANANAYYFWTHYKLFNAPYNPVPEKFDLTVLPNKTVTFYVTDSGPALYAGNDNFAAVISQIRQAAGAWNSVSTSDLRVAYGGVYAAGTPQNTPGGQVIFEQLPPGILGLGGVAAKADISTSPNNSFYPIVTSLIHLTRDLTQSPGPSYTDFFFLDVVHEMGHALGLQHTFTSSAMSQATTRNTTLTRTIDADDVAGISVLYPNASFAGSFGSISGRVVFTNGTPAHLASVVAIRAGASPVSGFTNPDGAYRIDGILPGSYFVYVHPIPPTADVVSPLDPRGNPVAPTGPFTTLWYPGTPGFGSEVAVPVTAGAVLPNINFTVTARASLPLYDVKVYSYINSNYDFPAYVNENTPTATVSAQGGVGLGTNGAGTPGLNAQILGGAANIYATTAYADGLPDNATWFALYMQFGLGSSGGPQHLVFSLLPDPYTYILANGVNLTLNNPPAVTNIFGNADGSASITGSSFASDSRFYLDGAPLTVRSIDTVNGIAVVVPPTGTSGQHATPMVVNDDGQNSFFWQPNPTVSYNYPTTSQPGLLVSPNNLPAGVEAMVDITGVNTNFAQGQTIVGFGSSDIFVRRVFVLSPTHLQANVYVEPGAALTFTEVSVTSGFQLATQPFGFQVTALNARLPVAYSQLVNTVAGQTAIYAGDVVSVFGSNLAVNGALPTVTFNGIPAIVLFASPSQINLQIPAGLPLGPVSMVVANQNGASYPVDVNIDPAPTALTGVLNPSSVLNDSSHPAHVGDVITILLSGFADPTTTVATSRVQLSVNGVGAPTLLIAPYGTDLFQIQTFVPRVSTGNQPLAIFLDGALKAQGTIFIQ